MVTTEGFVTLLESSHRNRNREFPARQSTERFLDELLSLLFPHFASDRYYCSRDEIRIELKRLERRLTQLIAPLERQMSGKTADITSYFLTRLPEVYEMLSEDAEAIYNGDPAAESVDEVIAAYPGFYAIAAYRVAHCFYQARVPVFPRILTEYAHLRTGVDIHPGARIGRAFFIDHATGIVIGETTEIGDHVKLYQGVTLGALSVSKEMQRIKRHPTIGDRVIIYSNATILGGETVIGHDSVVGGNAWITSTIDPFSVVYNRAEVHVRDARPSNYEVVFHI